MAEVTAQSLQSQGASPTSAAVSHIPQIPSKASSVSAQAAQSDADYTQVGSQLLSLSSESLSALPSPMHPAAVPPAVAQDVNNALARSLLQGPHASGLTEAHSARLTSAYSGKFQRSSLHTHTAWSTEQPSTLVKSSCLQHECVLHATVQPRRQAESLATPQECTDVPTYTPYNPKTELASSQSNLKFETPIRWVYNKSYCICNHQGNSCLQRRPQAI